MRARFVLVSALALPAILPMNRARADVDAGEDGDAEIEAGVALRRQFKDGEALVHFQRAYALRPTARAFAQIALAEAALGQWVTAEADLLRALAWDDPWIDRQKKALQMALGEIDAHLGTLEVTGPAGAEVSIDGVLAGRLPQRPLRVPAKRLAVELRLPGLRPGTQEVEVESGARSSVSIALEPWQADEATSPRPLTLPTAPSLADHAGGAQRTALWVSAVGAAVFASAGVALTLVAADQAAHYNGDAACDDAPGVPRSKRCPGFATATRTAEAGAAVAYSMAAASAVTASVLFLTLPGDPARRLRLSLTPAPLRASLELAF